MLFSDAGHFFKGNADNIKGSLDKELNQKYTLGAYQINVKQEV